MPYSDMIPDIREALSVSAQHDASILRGIRRNAQYLLRNYNFPESLLYAAVPLTTVLDISAPLSSAVGKIKGVRLKLPGATWADDQYKVLRRREETIFKTHSGPDFWWRDAAALKMNQPINALGYTLEYFYQTVDPAAAEWFLSTTYSDVLQHRTIYEMAPNKRKPEAMQVYGSLWQEDMAVLANYLQELEFEGMEMLMRPASALIAERYPSV